MPLMLFSFALTLFFSPTGLAQEASALKSPSVSANALFLYRNSNFHQGDADPTNPDSTPNGFNVREMELQFFSDVDPYTRLNLILAIHPEIEVVAGEIQETWAIEPEEAFVTSNYFPATTLALGKFKAAIGKHNLLHTHAFPFIEAPLANQFLLGDEGFNDVGVSSAVFLPAPWFSEITFQYLRGEGENTQFNSPSPQDGVGVAHWKNLWDLSEALTMELGASYAQGANSFRKTTAITGGDLTFKWRPTEGGRYQSWIWSTEYLSRSQEQPGASTENGNGITSFIQYQFAQRWAGLYRYDDLVVKNSLDPLNLPNDTRRRHSVGLVFMPSEFSSFKMEYNQRNGGPVSATNETTERSFFLQGNFTIGSHPAHSY